MIKVSKMADSFSTKLRSFEFTPEEFANLSPENQKFCSNFVEEIFSVREKAFKLESAAKTVIVLKNFDEIHGVYTSMETFLEVGCVIVLDRLSQAWGGDGHACYDYVQSLYDELSPDSSTQTPMLELLRIHFRKNKIFSFGWHIEEQKIY